MPILAAITGVQWFLCLLLIAVCVLLIVIVLLQRGSAGGLAGAFGGGGGSSAFGAKTGDVFTLITVVLACVYLLIAVVGNFWFVPPGGLEERTPTPTVAPGTAPQPVEGELPGSTLGDEPTGADDTSGTPGSNSGGAGIAPAPR